MCEIIARLYELQREFDRMAPPDAAVDFDNGIVDCVTACTSVMTDHIRHTVRVLQCFIRWLPEPHRLLDMLPPYV